MIFPSKLAKFLKKHRVYYQVQVHPWTATCSQTAEEEHVSGKKMAKVVMVKADDNDAMVVLPAHRKIDLFKLSTELGTHNVKIDEEKDFEALFPDCEVGAMPPFGKLYGMPVYADKALKETDELFFNAGNHLETICISTDDFFRVAKASVGDFSVPISKAA